MIHDYRVNVTAHNSSGIIQQNEHVTEVESITFPLTDQSPCTVYNSSIHARSYAGLVHVGMADMISNFEGKP